MLPGHIRLPVWEPPMLFGADKLPHIRFVFSIFRCVFFKQYAIANVLAAITMPKMIPNAIGSHFWRYNMTIVNNNILSRHFALFAHAVTSSEDRCILGWLYGAKNQINAPDRIKETKAIMSFHSIGKAFRKNTSPAIEYRRHLATDFAWNPFVRVRSKQKAKRKPITVAGWAIIKPRISNGTNPITIRIRFSNAYCSHSARSSDT